MTNIIRAIVLAVLIPLVGTIFYQMHVEKKASGHWPSIEGKVLESHIKEVVRESDSRNHGFRDHYYTVEVKYEYTVDAKTYVGNRIKVSGVRYRTQIDAETEKNKYEPGSPVEVFYDPSYIKASVLIPG